MPASAKTGSQAGRRLGYLFKHAGLLMSELNDAVLAPFGIEPRELGILIVIVAVFCATVPMIATATIAATTPRTIQPHRIPEGRCGAGEP